jgi:deoxyribonuclease-4
MGSGVEAGVRRVAEALNHLLDERPGQDVTVLLETTAGQGTTLGRSFEELASILELVEDQRRVGICLDTCHVFAAGYDIRDDTGYAATMESFDEAIGFDRLKVFHFNDSKKGLGSHVDRHTHIGEGEIGLDAFRMIVNDERFANHPGILETPKDDAGDDDRRNLAALRGLCGALAETPAL